MNVKYIYIYSYTKIGEKNGKAHTNGLRCFLGDGLFQVYLKNAIRKWGSGNVGRNVTKTLRGHEWDNWKRS